MDDVTAYVTLEPCVMCAGALLYARVARVVIGAMDEKGGAVGSRYNLLSDPRLMHEASAHLRRAGRGVGGAAARLLRRASRLTRLGRRLLERVEVVADLDRHGGSFADGRRDLLGRAGAHVAGGEDAVDARAKVVVGDR